MAFGQELKDFAAGFGTGVGLREKMSRSNYYDSLSKKAEGDTFDIRKAAQDDPAYDGSFDDTKGHGLLYNLGNWIGIGDDDKKPRPNPASPIEAVSAASAVPMDAYESQYAPDTDGYVGGYAAGGLVVDEEDPDQAAAAAAAPSNSTPGRMSGDPEPSPPPAAVPMDDQPAPAVEEVTSTPAATAAPASDMAAANSPEMDGATGRTLSAALHGGIQALQTEFGLKHQGVPDQEAMAAGRERLMSGEGRASTADMKAVARAVDPKGELSHSQMMLRAMTKGYEFYMERGMPDKANNYAASIIQYASFQASKHGEDAIQLIQKGDLNGAAKSLAAGYSNIPDGKEATNVKVNPDKTVTVTETDVATGKAINQHTITGMQLYQAAIGLANKSESWKAIMSAAAAAKGVNLPPSDAYNGAVDRLNGVNADGTVTQPGNAPPANYQPQGAGGAAPASPPAAGPQGAPQGQSGALIARADPSAMHQVESGGNHGAVSPKGAVGIAQTMPNTLRDPGFGVQPAKDNSPQELQRVGDEYLAAMNAHYKDPVLAHIAYNMGPGNTDRWLKAGGQFSKLPQETQQYLGRIAVAQSQGGRAAPAGVPAAPGAPAQGQSMRPRPALPEDQVEKPEIPGVPERPVAPEQVRVTSKDTEGMSGPERVAYTRQVAEQNKLRQKKFTEDMQLYNSAVSARDKAQKAAAKGGPKDEFKLPVKDRTDAINALKEVRPDPADATDPTAVAFSKFQPTTQKAVDDVAYGLYTHNDTTPQRAYQAATSMMIPNSMNFTPYETGNPGMVKVVFRSGDKLLMPKNTFDQLAAARGNEHFVMRSGAEAEAKKSGENAALGEKAGKAGRAVLNVAKNAKRALVDENIGTGGKPAHFPNAIAHPIDTAKKVGRGILSAVDEGIVNERLR